MYQQTTRDTRPVLVGMNNPISLNPEHALYPWPPGCAGHRLYSMLAEVAPGMGMAAYARLFDRRNLVRGPWNAALASTAADAMRVELAGRQVVLLGREVARAFGLADLELCTHTLEATRATTFYLLAHPSGRNLHYNKPENRAAAGHLLARLLGIEPT
jgi:hypothetical protein